jgi:hypothetical protein
VTFRPDIPPSWAARPSAAVEAEQWAEIEDRDPDWTILDSEQERELRFVYAWRRDL